MGSGAGSGGTRPPHSTPVQAIEARSWLLMALSACGSEDALRYGAAGDQRPELLSEAALGEQGSFQLHLKHAAENFASGASAGAAPGAETPPPSSRPAAGARPFGENRGTGGWRGPCPSCSRERLLDSRRGDLVARPPASPALSVAADKLGSVPARPACCRQGQGSRPPAPLGGHSAPSGSTRCHWPLLPAGASRGAARWPGGGGRAAVPRLRWRLPSRSPARCPRSAAITVR